MLSAVVALLLFGFVQISDEMREGETRAFHEAILIAFGTPGDLSQPIGSPWVQEMVREFTALEAPASGRS